MSHKPSSSTVSLTCGESGCVYVKACMGLSSSGMCVFDDVWTSLWRDLWGMCCMQKDACLLAPESTHTHTYTHTQVIFVLACGRWDSKDNNKVWLYILFSQTSSKLSLSPSSCVLWGSSKSQHPSHFRQLACPSSPLLKLSTCSCGRVCMYASDRLRLFGPGLSCCDRAAVWGNIRLTRKTPVTFNVETDWALPANGNW